MYNWFTCRKC